MTSTKKRIVQWGDCDIIMMSKSKWPSFVDAICHLLITIVMSRPAKQAKLTSFFKSQSEVNSPQASSSSDIAECDEQQTSTSRVVVESEQYAIEQSHHLMGKVDIGDFVSGSPITDEEKMNCLSNTWEPSTSYKFPRVERTVKGKVRYLSFQRKWLTDFKWLAYSPSKCGGFCKSCVLFAPESVRGAQLQVLVKKPMKNYKDAINILSQHASKAYHKLAHSQAENFVSVQKSSTGNVIEQMSHHRAKQAKQNRKVMASLLSVIKLCGRQMLSLRGHRDYGRIEDPTNEPSENEGNFRALIRFRIDSGDEDLKRYVMNLPVNAMYTSPGIQNQMIELCEENIRTEIVERATRSGYFSVLADETTDASNAEQFSISIRYVHVAAGAHEMREDFLGFVEAKSLTGEYLANLLLETLSSWGLDLDQMRGQGYDGAANMSGRFRGVQAKIKEKYPKALFTHCHSHCLNLVVGEACQLPALGKTIRTIKEVIVFISSSPKRMLCLTNAISALLPKEKRTRLKALCETRWVQRHESIALFHQMYSPILHALADVEASGDSISSDKADGFLRKLRTMEFVTNLAIMANTLSVTYNLSVALQCKTIDLIECAKMVNEVKRCLQGRLDNADEIFGDIFNGVKSTLEREAIPIELGTRRSAIPREQLQSSMLNNNYKPFVSSTITHLDERFGQTFQRAIKCACIIPLHMRQSKFPFINMNVIANLLT